MIQEFLHSWELFANAYLAGWLIAVLLALAGVLVVARDQIFLSAAVAQASTFGIALGLSLGGLAGVPALAWLRTDAFAACMAVGFAVIAVLLAARPSRPGRESAEAVTGWVFLVSASGSILLLSHSPHGLDEIYRLLSSSIIGATAAEVGLFGSLLAITVALLVAFHRRILLIVLDPTMAAAVGLRARPWSAAMAVWLGLAAGLSLRVSGMLYTFGCLVLPALAAKNLCREVRSMFFVAPLIALAAGIIGYMLANYYDYPPAQSTVALLGMLVAISWAVRKFTPS